MLRIALWCGVVALFTAGSTPARAEDADKGVKAIIAKAIEAKGGAANVEKYKAGTATFKATLTVMGMDLAMTGTSKDQAPDKSRFDAKIKAGGQEIPFVMVLNGNKGWQGANGDIKELDKEALAEAREQMHASLLTDLRGLNDKSIKLKALGESKVDDKAVTGVLVSAEGYRDVKLFFDKDSGLLLKSETKGKDVMGGGGEYASETFYSDYKKVNGLSVAHKIKELRDGKTSMVMEMTSVAPAEKLDDKEFAKP